MIKPVLPPTTSVGIDELAPDVEELQGHIIITLVDPSGRPLDTYRIGPIKSTKLGGQPKHPILRVKERLETLRALRWTESGRRESLFDHDVYTGSMGPERGDGGAEFQSSPDSEPQPSNRYEQAIEGLPLNGTRPEVVVIDQEGEAYLGMKDAAAVSGISRAHLGNLVRGDRISAITINGHEKYLGLSSLINFLLYERRPRGRPRKTNP